MATQSVKVTLGGKERTLKYTLWSIGEVGERLGIEVRLAHLTDDLLGAKLSLKALCTILWAGLIHEEPELTEQQVGQWVDQDNLPEVLNAFFALFGAQLSDLTRQTVEESLGVEPTAQP